MTKVLIVTNDFPPRSGGIQSFVHALAARLPADRVVVYAPTWDGAAAFDARQGFGVVRHPRSLMLPVPDVRRRAARLLTEHDCDTVLFGAAAPLGLLAPHLRRAGADRIAALTHGHEAGWAALPGARSLLRKIADEVDVVTYLGEYFRVRMARAMSAAAAGRMVRLAPGVDPAVFRSGVGGGEVRQRLGIDRDRPVVLCVSRMVPRKGQDTLIRAWPQVLRRSAAKPLLLLVGDGPYRRTLDRLVTEAGIADSVVLQQIEPEHQRIAFLVRIPRQRRPVLRRDHLDHARMRFRSRDVEKGDAAARDGRQRKHRIEHSRWVMVGGIFGGAGYLEHAVAAGKRLTDIRAVTDMRGRLGERDIRHG